MAQNNKVQRNRYGISSRPILSLLVGLSFFTVVFLVTMLSTPKDTGYQRSQNTGITQQNGQETKQDDSLSSTILAVVKKVDTENQRIMLFDVNRQELLELNYFGGTNITDKYGKAIAISQIKVGEMVDATYLTDKKKLTDMNLSTKAWTYTGVSNMGINLSNKTMKIAKTLYKYEDDILILDGEEFIPVADLAEQDELTVRGFEETIWSITVTRGHGTVILKDYEDFLGDYITIGYEAIQQIAEDMEIIVREGNFNLTVENGNYSATKNITVDRNQDTYVSLSDLGPGASKLGRISFEITPFGADLYLDGELVSYANPIEMEYNEHNMKVSMGGYTSYVGTLTVDSSGKTVKIDLPESSSVEAATVTETEDGSTTNSSTGTSTGNTTDGAPAGSTTGSTGTEDIDANHLINVQNPSGVSVYIDGEFKCTSPGSFQKMIGTHVITFIKEGYKTMSYTIEVSDDGLDSYYTFPDLTKE